MGFLELQRQCGVSHEVLRGAQGASHVALGKSGLHAHCEGERVIALESWKVYRASRTVKERRGIVRPWHRHGAIFTIGSQNQSMSYFLCLRVAMCHLLLIPVHGQHHGSFLLSFHIHFNPLWGRIRKRGSTFGVLLLSRMTIQAQFLFCAVNLWEGN